MFVPVSSIVIITVVIITEFLMYGCRIGFRAGFFVVAIIPRLGDPNYVLQPLQCSKRPLMQLVCLHVRCLCLQFLDRAQGEDLTGFGVVWSLSLYQPVVGLSGVVFRSS